MVVYATSGLARRGWLNPIWLAAISLSVLAVAAGIAIVWQRYRLDQPVQAALIGEDDARLVAYRRELIGGHSVVLNLEAPGPTATEISVTRMLLKAAVALRNENFDRVYLAAFGDEKFYLDGSFFRTIGNDPRWQDPDYAIQNIPQHVMNPDGTTAFGAAQQSSAFHERWWANAASSQPISVS